VDKHHGDEWIVYTNSYRKADDSVSEASIQLEYTDTQTHAHFEDAWYVSGRRPHREGKNIG
jgi:mannose-6-phosphate isomerase-like protein (cupin superfamily)